MKIECFSSSSHFWRGKVRSHISAILLILLASLAVDICPLSGETLPQSITILYSNNINGEIDPCPSWGETIRFGGLARRGTWVKEAAEREKRILLVDAGDLFFKKFSTPLPENEIDGLSEKARLILKSFDLMVYHAIGIGDDDLSLGKKFLIELSKGSRIPFLSSNVIDEDSGKPLFERYLIREVNGLKVGIFSLLSQDLFLGPSDAKKKGLIFLDPIETAQEMVRELGPRTDLIVLLSHLSYPKDKELAQKISGIHIIAGSHTGARLSNPHVIKNTIILQTSSQGKYAGRLDLTLLSKEAPFFNKSTERSLKSNLNRIRYQLRSRQTSEAQKAQWQKAKERYESALQQFEGKNPFTNIISPLSQQVQDHPDIKKMVDDYKSKFPEKSDPPVHDSRGTYKPKP